MHSSYQAYFTSATVKSGGYAGTGLLCKQAPLKVTYGMGISAHDQEGRLITAEFDRFFFVNACTLILRQA